MPNLLGQGHAQQKQQLAQMQNGNHGTRHGSCPVVTPSWDAAAVGSSGDATKGPGSTMISPANTSGGWGSVIAGGGPGAAGHGEKAARGGFPGTQVNMTGQSQASSGQLRTTGLAVLRSGPFRRQMVSNDYPKKSFFIQDYRHAYNHVEQMRELKFLRELFLSADTNHSGDVDYDEFQACMLNPETARIFMQRFGFQPHMAVEIFRSLDSDGSGEVDVEEWIAKLKILMEYVDSGKVIKDWRSRALKEIPGYSVAGCPEAEQKAAEAREKRLRTRMPILGPEFPRAPQSTQNRTRNQGPMRRPQPLPTPGKASNFGALPPLGTSRSATELASDELKNSQYFMKLYPVKL